jgi:hypothetical protein
LLIQKRAPVQEHLPASAETDDIVVGAALTGSHVVGGYGCRSDIDRRPSQTAAT